MKPNPLPKHSRSGTTLIEIIVVIAVIVVLAAILLPDVSHNSARRSRIGCVCNLKQIGLGFRNWAIDHDDKFPMSLATTNGGTMDHPLVAQPWMHLLLLSNELVTPKILVCPADQQMKEASVFDASFGSNNVSYFVSVNATEEKPSMFLVGDRNITLNAMSVGSGLITLATNANLGWTEDMHQLQGNIGLADGSVQQASSSRFTELNTASGKTNRLAVP